MRHKSDINPHLGREVGNSKHLASRRKLRMQDAIGKFWDNNEYQEG